MGQLTHLSGFTSGIVWRVPSGEKRTIAAGLAGDFDYRLNTRGSILLMYVEAGASIAFVRVLEDGGDPVMLNGKVLELDMIAELREHDVLTAGGTRLVWTQTPVPLASGADPVPRAFPPGCRMILEGEGSPVTVMGDSLTIGREATNDLRIEGDRKVGLRHARLFMRDGVWFLFDVGAGSGTFLNDRIVSVPTELRDGDTFRIGDRSWTVALPNSSPRRKDQPAAVPSNHEDVGLEDDFDLVEARQALGVGDLSLMNPLFVLTHDQPWKRFSGRWALFLMATPFVALAVGIGATSSVPFAYIIATYFALLWLAVLRPVFGTIAIRPSRLFPALLLMPFLIAIHLAVMQTEPMRALAPATVNEGNIIRWILGVGLAEEFWKAVPLLGLLLALRRGKVAEAMYVGLASGLAFGIYESAGYVQMYADRVRGNEHLASFLSLTMLRVVSLPLLHGVWTGIVGYFVGVGARVGDGAQWLAVLGLVLSAITHGVYDWSGGNLPILAPFVAVFSMLVFVSYARAARLFEHLQAAVTG